MNLLDCIIFYHLKRRGIEIVYWVMNTHEEYNRAIRAKVDGIITDCPTQLKAYTEQHKNSNS